MEKAYPELFFVLETWTMLADDVAVDPVDVKKANEYLVEALRQWTFMTIVHREETLAFVEQKYRHLGIDAHEHIDIALAFGQRVADFRRRLALRDTIPVM